VPQTVNRKRTNIFLDRFVPPRDFVRNFDDMSTSDGYQFKFRCDICGDGYVTKWRDAPFAKASNLGQFGPLSQRPWFGPESSGKEVVGFLPAQTFWILIDEENE
jgi:hypothetical protein